jgi:hypothetical protein
LADDHEFWNNHPNPPLNAWSWLRKDTFWKSWRSLALERHRAIQNNRRTTSITLARADDAGKPGLSLFLADTSVDRQITNDFMSKDSMTKLTSWLRSLPCPGVLALGQPLHTDKGDAWSRKLPGFEQFSRDLLPALTSAPHDVVVLAGDSHFGRIATARVSAKCRVIEVITSPLALVNHAAGGAASDGPTTIPASIGGAAVTYDRKIPSYESEEGLVLSEEHGLTLSFAQGGASTVHLDIRAWFPRAAAPIAPWRWSTVLA